MEVGPEPGGPQLLLLGRLHRLLNTRVVLPHPDVTILKPSHPLDRLRAHVPSIDGLMSAYGVKIHRHGIQTPPTVNALLQVALRNWQLVPDSFERQPDQFQSFLVSIDTETDQDWMTAMKRRGMFTDSYAGKGEPMVRGNAFVLYGILQSSLLQIAWFDSPDFSTLHCVLILLHQR